MHSDRIIIKYTAWGKNSTYQTQLIVVKLMSFYFPNRHIHHILYLLFN